MEEEHHPPTHTHPSPPRSTVAPRRRRVAAVDIPAAAIWEVERWGGFGDGGGGDLNAYLCGGDLVELASPSPPSLRRTPWPCLQLLISRQLSTRPNGIIPFLLAVLLTVLDELEVGHPRCNPLIVENESLEPG
ncbi:sulfate transmembrane transporter [Actinidia rufa]|nr:sulfate transmembrane transporter [Actinidia rufa]